MLKTTVTIILTITAIACHAGNTEQTLAADIESLERLYPDTAVAVLHTKLDSVQSIGHKAYTTYAKALEKLLASPEQATHSEQLWMAALRHISTSAVMSDDEKARPRLLLDEARKNQIGARADDISLRMKDGTTTSLRKEAATQRYTLLYFTNPDCEACQLTKQRIAESEIISALTNDKVLKVVAVYPLDDERLWRATNMPANVVDTWDSTASIEEGELYALPSMPLFYLLDNEMTVIMKNEASLKRMEAALRKVGPSSLDSNSLAKELFKH